MSRISIPTAEQSVEASKPLLAAVKQQLGVVPNLMMTVAEFNGCNYCLSAHDYLGRNVAKLSDGEIDAARDGHSQNTRADAALQFARRVVEHRGRVTDTDLATLRGAGFDEASVIEIVVTVALNVLTNYVNNVAQTDIDFPRVSARIAA